MRRRLIILANSRKHGNRCIAGIDMETGEWVRPCRGDSGIRGEEGDKYTRDLLDILEIPLEDDGPHRELQPENRRIGEGPWRRVGRATVEDIEEYCQRTGPLFYNTDRCVHPDEVQLARASGAQPVSLSLIRPSSPVCFRTRRTRRGVKGVQAEFTFSNHRYCLPVTDYWFERGFPAGHTETLPCLLAVSLGLPFEEDGYCYKLVAGVIRLSQKES